MKAAVGAFEIRDGDDCDGATLAAVIVGVSITIGTADEAENTVGRMVGRLVTEIAVVGEAKSEGWTDEDTADARRMAANFMRLETRLVGELFLGSLEETLSGLLSIVKGKMLLES